MNIALIGYGKMGKAIEQIALERGHKVGLIIDLNNLADLTGKNLAGADVAIEFTGPESALDNVMTCLRSGVPVVCGSTGWLKDYEKARNACMESGSALLVSSNFSVGVNLFFALNENLARLMAAYPEYKPSLKEIHHTQKKDAPSGTAISLAQQVMKAISGKKTWVNRPSENPSELSILSERTDPAPGTHHVRYDSEIDSIEIIHTAHNRKGFASGAVLAAEFLAGKKGIFTMKEVLGM